MRTVKMGISTTLNGRKKMKIKFLKPKALVEIYTRHGVYLQHYNSIVAFRPEYGTDRTIEIGEDWNYSRTTMKHVGHFLNSNAAEIRKNIAVSKWKLNTSLGDIV
jgi:hypothetical protein